MHFQMATLSPFRVNILNGKWTGYVVGCPFMSLDFCPVNPTQTIFVHNKNSTFMQKYFSLFAFLLFSTFVQAQGQSLGCWDFEEACSIPSNAFLQGCIARAIATSGQPGNASTAPGVNAVSGAKYATLDIRHCDNETRVHGDGIALKVNIASGRKIRISFNYYFPDAPAFFNPLLGVHLTNGISAFGGPGSCNDNDLIPGIPTGTVTAGGVRRTTATANSWVSKSFEITTTQSYSQVWFRPALILSEIPLNAAEGSLIHLDNVCITDITCEPKPFKLSACKDDQQNTINYTIIGYPGVPQGNWILYRLNSCTGGSPILPPVAINWQSANTFSLPANSGCYRLGYWFNPSANSGCTTARFISSNINTTVTDGLPICDPSACTDWTINVDEQLCTSLSFQLNSQNPFPPGTVIAESINGVFSGNSDGLVQYSPVDDGDNRWLQVCFTVFQPDCGTTETKCEYRYIYDCPGFTSHGSNDRSEPMVQLTDKQTLRFNNPADQYIRFSAPIEAGVAQLYTMQGALVKSFVLNGTQQLEVGDMPNGQYMLSVQQAGQRDTKLVVIMH